MSKCNRWDTLPKVDKMAVVQLIFQEGKTVDRITEFTCKMGDCPKPNRKRIVGSGWTNVFENIPRYHNDTWEALYDESKKGANTKYNKFFQKNQPTAEANNIFGWLEWIILTDQPFRFVSNKFTKNMRI